MKKFLLLCFLFFTCFTLSAQTSNPDTIYLKNGAIVKGTIVEQTPNGSLKIITSDGLFKTYSFDEIDRMVKGKSTSKTTIENDGSSKTAIVNAETPKPVTSVAKPRSKKGYKSIINFGYSFGNNYYFDIENRFNAKYIAGYQFNDHLMLGGGAGLNFYYDVEEVSMPIFAHLRWTWFKTKVSPFLSTSFGYNVSLSDGYFDGVFGDIDMGVVFPIKNNRKMAISLGYEFNELDTYGYDYNYTDYNGYRYTKEYESDITGAINLKVAILF